MLLCTWVNGLPHPPSVYTHTLRDSAPNTCHCLSTHPFRLCRRGCRRSPAVSCPGTLLGTLLRIPLKNVQTSLRIRSLHSRVKIMCKKSISKACSNYDICINETCFFFILNVWRIFVHQLIMSCVVWIISMNHVPGTKIGKFPSSDVNHLRFLCTYYSRVFSNSALFHGWPM